MKVLYFDCKSGISGDMVLSALSEIAGAPEAELMPVHSHKGEHGHIHDHDDAHEHSHEHAHSHDHGHTHDHDDSHAHHHDHAQSNNHDGGHTHTHGHDGDHGHHGRSYEDVKALISGSTASEKAKQIAEDIYGAIARAECKVHGMELENAHFHEVGRDEAVLNAVRIGECIEKIAPDAICCSDIYDGHGTVKCSHGIIPVPVPAVAAMMEVSDYSFRTADVDTEMVTPSGLAAMIGMGACPAEKQPEGKIIASAISKGRRDTGLEGFKALLIEC